MQENRDVPRYRVLKPGSIHFGQAGTIDCIVRNLSADGALLQVESPVGIPNSFTLVIARGDRHTCEVAWRSAKQIGVSFKI